MTIFIGNLSWDAERDDLVHLFGQYGEVSKCSLPLDRDTGRKRGFGFVDLVNEADPVDEARSKQLLAGQHRYTAYRAEKDPARGMLTRFYGSEWTEAYIHDVLFDL